MLWAGARPRDTLQWILPPPSCWDQPWEESRCLLSPSWTWQKEGLFLSFTYYGCPVLTSTRHTHTGGEEISCLCISKREKRRETSVTGENLCCRENLYLPVSWDTHFLWCPSPAALILHTAQKAASKESLFPTKETREGLFYHRTFPHSPLKNGWSECLEEFLYSHVTATPCLCENPLPNN